MADKVNNKMFDSYKQAMATAASVTASVVLVRSILNGLLPHELQNFLFSGLSNFRSRLSSEDSIVIDQNEGYASNLTFEAVRTYLATRITASISRLRVSQLDEGKSMVVSLEPGEQMIDVFDGVEFKWQMISKQINRSNNSNGYKNFVDTRNFEVRFHRRYKDKALNSYLPHIMERAKAIKEKDRTLQLHTNENDSWYPINLHHPFTFENLAMDADLKSKIMADLDRFIGRRDYYQRIGKAWKRGYLLYGPPGTGKTSLIAAIANYLRFDIYDLELSEVRGNRMLRQLLVAMPNRSILVVEDIDCAIDLKKRDDAEAESSSALSSSNHDKITLSGLLNFIDGLWSTSGEERIIILTTNYKERLDPALLRPGRMDFHGNMGYCGTNAFRILASNYHEVSEHQLFPEIEEAIREVEVTPAEVAEELMRSEDVDAALEGLLQFLIREKEDARRKTKKDLKTDEKLKVELVDATRTPTRRSKNFSSWSGRKRMRGKLRRI